MISERGNPVHSLSLARSLLISKQKTRKTSKQDFMKRILLIGLMIITATAGQIYAQMGDG
jgi:hypothetical protein